MNSSAIGLEDDRLFQRAQSSEKTTCYHCGEPCLEEVIHKKDHNFCCHACATVYEMITESGLSEYYKLGVGQGSRGLIVGDRFAILEREEVERELLEFCEGNQARIRLRLPDIHCASCIWLLENLYRLNPGVSRVEVDFSRKSASISFDRSQVSTRALCELLTMIGYEPEIKAGGLEKDQQKRKRRLFLVRLGLSGFCFGNIMLFSLPEYLGAASASDHRLMLLFSILNLVMGLSVFLIGGWPWLYSAVAGLKNKHFSIDVPIAIGFVAIAGKSVFDIINGSGPGYFDSLSGLIFLLLIGRWYQNRAFDSLQFDRDYKSFFPLSVRIEKGEQEEIIKLEELETGMRLKILPGELNPADTKVISGSVRVDYSFVTGESEPVEKVAGETVFAGGRILGSAAILEVVRKVDAGYLSRLWNETDNSREKTEVDGRALIDRVAVIFTYSILVVAFFTTIYWWVVNPAQIMDALVAVLLVACPCALALSWPLTYGSSIRRLAKAGLFVKNEAVVELMATTDTLVFDKTGTITELQAGDLTYEGRGFTQQEMDAVFTVASASAHPSSTAIAMWFNGLGAVSNDSILELISEEAGVGVKGRVGELEVFIGRPAQQEEKSNMLNERATVILLNGIEVGRVRFANKYREGIDQTLQHLGKHFNLHLLSGDHDGEAERLKKMANWTGVLFRQKPEDKRSYIEELSKTKRVMMFGDGLNDAGALAASRVGISISNNRYHFTPACDAIVPGTNLTDIENYLIFAKKSRKLLFVSFGVSIAYNLIGIAFAVSGHLNPFVAAILMPASSLSLLITINLGMKTIGKQLSKISQNPQKTHNSLRG